MFDPEKLRRQKNELTIPCRERTDLTFDAKISQGRSKSHEYVSWRSQLVVYEYTNDAIVGRIDLYELREHIVDRYAIGMRELGTVVKIVDVQADAERISLEARATEFMGRPLKEEHFPRKSEKSQAIIKLFLRESGRRGLRKPKILIGEMGDKFRIRHDQFIMSTRGILDEVVARAFLSGTFEGEILTSTVKLNADRKGFERNDGLVDFCLHLKFWYEEVAKPILAEIEDKTRDSRHAEVGITVLDWVAALLKQPEWSKFYEQFRMGSIGNGHIPVRTRGKTEREISIEGGSLRPRSWGNMNGVGPDGEGDQEKEIPGKERREHHPGTVEDERGKVRSVVRNNSIGLTFGHSNMLGDKRVYVFDEERGRLMFNTSHPLFVRCDEAGPMKLARYEQFIVMFVIVLQGQSSDIRHVQAKGFNDLLEMEVFRILSESMILRSRRKKDSVERERKLL